MKIIICGSREFDDYTSAQFLIKELLNKKDVDYDNCEIVSGHAAGADFIGEQFSKKYGISCKLFIPEWVKYGKFAGVRRNYDMVDYAIGDSDSFLIAFWDGKSKGTESIIKYAEKKHLPSFIFMYSMSKDFFTLHEGVSLQGDKYSFDFNLDSDEDIIPLCMTRIISTMKTGKLYYYGYRINKLSAENKVISNLLKYIKTNSDNAFIEKMIDQCVDNFHNSVAISSFDCIVKIPSSSDITNKIINKLQQYTKVDVVNLEKVDPKNISFDWNKFESKFKGDEQYLNKIKLYLKKMLSFNSDSISLSKQIPARYRQYLTNILKTSDAEKLASATNILIVDDIVTTGKTFYDAVEVLHESGFKGNITLFSLLRNY